MSKEIYQPTREDNKRAENEMSDEQMEESMNREVAISDGERVGAIEALGDFKKGSFVEYALRDYSEEGLKGQKTRLNGSEEEIKKQEKKIDENKIVFETVRGKIKEQVEKIFLKKEYDEYTDEDIKIMNSTMNNFYMFLKGGAYGQKDLGERTEFMDNINKVIEKEFPNFNPQEITDEIAKFRAQDTNKMSEEERKKYSKDYQKAFKMRTILLFPIFKKLIEKGFDPDELHG